MLQQQLIKNNQSRPSYRVLSIQFHNNETCTESEFHRGQTSRAIFCFISRDFLSHNGVETRARANISAVEYKASPSLSHERVSLISNAPHPDKIALTNGANRSEIAHFQILFSKVPKTLVNQQDTGKVSNFGQ